MYALVKVLGKYDVIKRRRIGKNNKQKHFKLSNKSIDVDRQHALIARYVSDFLFYMNISTQNMF